MSNLELDDQILEHPKFIRAAAQGGSGAIHLWLGLRAYCGIHLTDGRIPLDVLPEIRGPRSKAARTRSLRILHEVALISTRDDAIYMHDYLQWSRSKEQVLADRARAKERQLRSRSKSNGGGGNGGNHDGKPPARPTSRRDDPGDDPGDDPRDAPNGHADRHADRHAVSHAAGHADRHAVSHEGSGSASDPDQRSNSQALILRSTARAHARKRDPEIAVTARTSEPGETPRPRHDPNGERIAFARWYPSQELLDWTRREGLDDRGFDAAIEDVRNKIRGPCDFDRWDDLVIKFLETAIASARRRPSDPVGVMTGETPEERERAEKEIGEQRCAEVAAHVERRRAERATSLERDTISNRDEAIAVDLEAKRADAKRRLQEFAREGLS